MKKILGSMIAVLVLIVGLSLPVAAQDTNYSCGAYSAGDYSEGDCNSLDNGSNTGDNEVSTDEGTVDGGGSASTDSDSGESGNDDSPSKDVEGGLFTVLFAKLMSSWGWLLFFGLLVVAGVVLIGWARRHESKN